MYKKIQTVCASLAIFALPLVSFARTTGGTGGTTSGGAGAADPSVMAPFWNIMYGINREIINPAILLLFTVAAMVFFYGLLKFVAKLSSEEERATGKRVMIWGSVGMFIMVAAFAIIDFIFMIVGVDPGDSTLF